MQLSDSQKLTFVILFHSKELSTKIKLH